jgi:hypothetical protein
MDCLYDLDTCISETGNCEKCAMTHWYLRRGFTPNGDVLGDNGDILATWQDVKDFVNQVLLDGE